MVDAITKERVDKAWARTVVSLSPYIHRNRDPKAILEVVRAEMMHLIEESDSDFEERASEYCREQGWRDSDGN